MRFFWFGSSSSPRAPPPPPPPPSHFFYLLPLPISALLANPEPNPSLLHVPQSPLSLFVQALSVLGIRPLRPMAAYEGGGGIGGKFPKRPFRRAPATPYERPPAAVRPARGHPAETRGNGWLSKLVDPASRIIAWSASRLFSSVFQKRLGPPPAAAPRMVLPLFSCSFPLLPRPQISRLGMSSPHKNEEPMERRDPTLACTKVHVLDLCPRKALCLRSVFHLLRRLPSCGLDTSPSFTQDALPLDLY
ncbi:hypothetical protein BHE74_00005604 [Ensete ventricosum]|nr:hypothetical protein BHE74_00005604 [Ensete ventricosum]